MYLPSVVNACLCDVNQSAITIANTKPSVSIPITRPQKHGDKDLQQEHCNNLFDDIHLKTYQRNIY
jgi:hypothetical protein